MANVLKMAERATMEALWRQGWSCRRIARELGLYRDTVRKYVRILEEGEAKPAKVTLGKLGDAESNSGPLVVEESSKPATEVTVGKRSQAHPYQTIILEKLEIGLSGQRIYQDLVGDHGFSGSYQSVKRYVRGLGATQPLPFRRIESAAGEECQVDFGQGAWVEVEGRKKRPWLFRIILSHSRKGYGEVVWRQTTESFIRCLENAFWSFGGTTKIVVLDNLRAAVTQADWFDPELNPKIEEFGRHYGIAFLPTKPYTPRHKGKVERGVGYAQENALKGKNFKSLQGQNEYLRHWEESVADLRIHGTIKKQVKQQFEEGERPMLSPLPADRFPFFQEGQRKVHRDAHIEIERAYYSVPPEYLSHTVWVRYDSRIVRIFNLRMEPIALHPRTEPGRFHTLEAHLSSKKISAVEKGAGYLLGRALRIGPKTALWAKAALEERGIQGVRVLQGLLSLATRHSGAQIESACELALSHGSYRLKTVRTLLSQPVRQENFEFMKEHPLIRDIAEYGKFIQVHFRKEKA